MSYDKTVWERIEMLERQVQKLEKLIVKGCYTCVYYYEKDNKCTNPRHRHVHLPKIECKEHTEKR